ncbi:HNH endonuclease [Pseudarthrobacter sp. NIBRBAC000502770]|nr:HNH endonuclease [Pseudarthrobacter sp. NIBRBAC000502770]
MRYAPRLATGRKAIPDDVKVFVMQRDAGSCRACGATTELQFDHIIPIAMGGSNEAQNLQILCGPCNRSKSAGLTVRRQF